MTELFMCAFYVPLVTKLGELNFLFIPTVRSSCNIYIDFKDKNQPNGEKKTLKLTQRKTNQGNEINTRTCAKTQIKGYVCSPHNLRDAHRNMKIARNNSAVKLSN